MTLSSRIEAGTAEQQRELLLIAWAAVSPTMADPYKVFVKLLEIGTDEAFTGAAMMLVPEEAFWSSTMRGVKRGGFHAVCAPRAAAVSFHACGCTPALAIAAACVKAKEMKVDERFAWPLGTRVTKTKGSSWTGRVVGFYSTELTPIGYAVESENEPGSVQIYPVTALQEIERG